MRVIIAASWGKGPLAEEDRKEYTYVHTRYHQVDSQRPTGSAPLWGADLLLEHRSPTGPQHPLRGLVSLRHYQRLRAKAPSPYHPGHHFRDLRLDCPRSLPNQKSGRTHGVVGHGHQRGGVLSVLDLGRGLYLRRTTGGAGLPGGYRGASQAAHHLRQDPAGGDRSSVHRARVRRERAARGGRLALRDPAQVGWSAVGVRTRFDVHLRSGVRDDDRLTGHPSDGARWRGGASHRWGVIAWSALSRPAGAQALGGVGAQPRVR